MQISFLNICWTVLKATSKTISVVSAVRTYAKISKVLFFVNSYIKIVLKVTAAIGKVNAHQEIKNCIFRKFLYITNIKTVKNSPKLNKICAKKSNSPVNLIYEINPIAGGAIKIKSVGINFGANGLWKIILFKITENKIIQKNIPIEK